MSSEDLRCRRACAGSPLAKQAAWVAGRAQAWRRGLAAAAAPVAPTPRPAANLPAPRVAALSKALFSTPGAGIWTGAQCVHGMACRWHGHWAGLHPNRHHTREGAAAPPRKSSARQSLLLCYSRDRAFAWKQHPGAPGAAACAPGKVGVRGLPTSTWGRRARRTCPGARWPDLWHIAASGPSVSHSMPPRAPLAGLAVLKRVGCPSRRPRRTSPPPGRRRLWLQTTDAAGAGSSEACMPSIDAKHACMRRLGAAANICEGISASLLGGTHQGKMNLWPPG